MSNTKIIADDSERIAEKIEARTGQIRGQIAACGDEYMGEKLRERLARLTSGMAVISVGCATEIETHERKLRLDDALRASLCARKDGVVAGGGVTYILAAKELHKNLTKFPKTNREGAEILAKSLGCILRQICINADFSPDVVAEKVVRGKLGFDARTGKFADMIKCGIIDPAAVIINVVRNAASVAGTLLTTEAIAG